MNMISMGAIPFSGNLASLLGGSGSNSRELFNPKEYVAWTKLDYINDVERHDRGMLVVDGNAVALVFSRQMSYKDALSYDDNTDGRHVIIFKGCDQTPDGVVCISVGSVDNLALLTAPNNLPDQVVICSSFTFTEDKLPKLTEELKRCGYLLIGDDHTFRGDKGKWSHAVVDEEASAIIGYVTKPGNAMSVGDDADGDMPGIARMFREMSRRGEGNSQISLNLTTTDTVLIEALIDFSEQVDDVNDVSKSSDWRSQCS